MIICLTDSFPNGLLYSFAEVVNKLIPDSISKDIEKSAQGIYPLHDVNIRKVKVLKKPKFDIGKLLELHGDVGKASSGEAGDGSAGASRPEGYEPPIQESVWTHPPSEKWKKYLHWCGSQ